MIVGAMVEYEASPIPTKPRRARKIMKCYKKKGPLIITTK